MSSEICRFAGGAGGGGGGVDVGGREVVVVLVVVAAGSRVNGNTAETDPLLRVMFTCVCRTTGRLVIVKVPDETGTVAGTPAMPGALLVTVMRSLGRRPVTLN